MIQSSNDLMLKVSWLIFMLGDFPRLFFRIGLIINKEYFSKQHRKEEHSIKRIIIQTIAQNAFYILSLLIIFFIKHDVSYIMITVIYCIEIIYKTKYQIQQKSAYVTRNKGHNINDFIIKPTRMVIALLLAYKLGQIAWIVGFGIIFCKWMLTRPYEEIFDVPNWFHAILVTASSVLVCIVYPLDIIRIIQPDNLKTYLSTVPQVYVAYVGLLGVFLGALLNENKTEPSKRKYVTGGFILNFIFVSVLVLFCIIGLLSYLSNEPLNMSGLFLFTENVGLNPADVKKYLMWGIIFPLSWFIFPVTIMTALLMLIETGRFIPNSLRKLKSRKVGKSIKGSTLLSLLPA